MRTQEIYTAYLDRFEYFGNTEIERIRMQMVDLIMFKLRSILSFIFTLK